MTKPLNGQTPGEALVELDQVQVYYNKGTAKEVQAVENVSFAIYPGETFGLVGESGSGKSTIGRSIVKLLEPTGGRIYFEGQAIDQIQTLKDRRRFNKDVQMIFQDPYASLNPRMKVRDIIAEGIKVHGIASGKQAIDQEVARLLETVGLNKDHANRYPHEFSGGQRQRIGIARALAVKPKFIVADEPISALDVSIQAQIINLLDDLQDEFNLTYLFIAHDLSMVRYFSDRIGIMHQGRLVELASSDQLYEHPSHPYTQSLLSAIPLPDPDYEQNHQRIILDESQLASGPGVWREVRPNHWLRSPE
ncbi:ABC transporter ATP-binding protein [Hutsoniella sourekii]